MSGLRCRLTGTGGDAEEGLGEYKPLVPIMTSGLAGSLSPVQSGALSSDSLPGSRGSSLQ